jgi:hypothetical protein
MGSENAHGCAQDADNCFWFDFLGGHHKDGNEFLSQIIWVTSDETWVLFMNVETEELWK